MADDQLRLMFLCCHPRSPDAQVALTLRLLGGLGTPEIARAFLVPEPTLAQRIVRAKRKLRDNHAPYRVPPAAELPDRLHAVLAAIYLIYTEGHTATTGDSLTRVDLSREAIRLGRVLTELMPDEPEAVGLLALMLLTEARRPARTATDGSMVRLADQDRTRWDRLLITEGHTLVRACLRRNQPGPFQVQAAIAAVHADAATAAATDWPQIVALYDQLYALRANPVIALNRAVAIGEMHGAAAGLDALDSLDVTQLNDYQPYHAARADLLARAGRREPAVAAYDRAIELTANPTERRFLERRRKTAAVERRRAQRSSFRRRFLAPRLRGRGVRVLLSDGSGLTARQVATHLDAAGHAVEVLTPDPLALTRFTRHVRRVHRVPPYGAAPFSRFDAELAVYQVGRFDVLLPTQEQVAVLSAGLPRVADAGISTAVPSFPALMAVQDKVSATPPSLVSVWRSPTRRSSIQLTSSRPATCCPRT